MVPYYQLSLADIFSSCQDNFASEKLHFYHCFYPILTNSIIWLIQVCHYLNTSLLNMGYPTSQGCFLVWNQDCELISQSPTYTNKILSYLLFHHIIYKYNIIH